MITKDKSHNIIHELNEQLIVFISEVSDQLIGDPDLPEIIRDLKRVQNHLHVKSLKLFNDENNKI